MLILVTKSLHNLFTNSSKKMFGLARKRLGLGETRTRYNIIATPIVPQIYLCTVTWLSPNLTQSVQLRQQQGKRGFREERLAGKKKRQSCGGNKMQLQGSQLSSHERIQQLCDGKRQPNQAFPSRFQLYFSFFPPPRAMRREACRDRRRSDDVVLVRHEESLRGELNPLAAVHLNAVQYLRESKQM